MRPKLLPGIAARYAAWSLAEALPGAECGALTFVQRFGSSLNLHVHFHVVVLDGVFFRDGTGDLRFASAPPPTLDDLLAMASAVRRRIVRWLGRRGYASGEEADVASADPLLACVWNFFHC